MAQPFLEGRRCIDLTRKFTCPTCKNLGDCSDYRAGSACWLGIIEHHRGFSEIVVLS
jgi:hypothetical protein